MWGPRVWLAAATLLAAGAALPVSEAKPRNDSDSDLRCFFRHGTIRNPRPRTKRDSYPWLSGDVGRYGLRLPSDETSTGGVRVWVTVPPKTVKCKYADSDPVCSAIRRDAIDEPVFGVLRPHSEPTFKRSVGVSRREWKAGRKRRDSLPKNVKYNCSPPCCDPICEFVVDIEKERNNTGTVAWEYLVPLEGTYWGRYSTSVEEDEDEDEYKYESKNRRQGWTPYAMFFLACAVVMTTLIYWCFCSRRKCCKGDRVLIVTREHLPAREHPPTRELPPPPAHPRLTHSKPSDECYPAQMN